jgi:hypothetical protein
MGPRPGRALINQGRKAGYGEHGTRHHTTEGPPRAAWGAHGWPISLSMAWPNGGGKGPGWPSTPRTSS